MNQRTSYRCNDVRRYVIEVLVPQDRCNVHIVGWLQETRHCDEEFQRCAEFLVDQGSKSRYPIVERVLYPIRVATFERFGVYRIGT